VLVIKYPYMYNKPILWRNTSTSLLLQPKIVYYSINSRSKNIMHPLKSYTSDTFLMGRYLQTVSRANVLSQ